MNIVKVEMFQTKELESIKVSCLMNMHTTIKSIVDTYVTKDSKPFKRQN